MADQPFQASYRRYRPQRFGEIVGQDHITTALVNAVRANRVAHAYLFSGPRGTGKTSTARILAAALNCANPVDGEPDGTCESCVAIRAGSSLDVLELDAASNNGVDAMRDLVSRAALGSPGRWKVYIVDEVHMLSPAASNALLKTLEEPPGHVVFVLATTDDQKVLPTIRSRTQHYRFRLLSPDVLSSLLAQINERADFGLDPATLDRVVQRGNGSARDALSALDQAAAAGIAEDEHETVPDLVEALIAHDAGAALVAVADAARRGRDAHRLAVEVVEHLRGGFLLVMAPDVAGVAEHQRAALEDQARRLGTPATVRAMEVLGETLVAMRESLDTRVTLELALVRLCAPAADTSPAAVLERLEMLERRMASPGPPPQGQQQPPPPRQQPPPQPRQQQTPPPPQQQPPPPPQQRQQPPTPPQQEGRADADAPPSEPAAASGPRATIGAMRQRPAPPRTPEARPDEPPAVSLAPIANLDRDELTKAWGDRIFGTLSSRARAAYRNGRWAAVDGSTALFLLATEMYRVPAQEKLIEVQDALSVHLGGWVNVKLEVEKSGIAPQSAPTPPPEWVESDVTTAEFAELDTAPDLPSSAEARLLEAFPGAEEIHG